MKKSVKKLLQSFKGFNLQDWTNVVQIISMAAGLLVLYFTVIPYYQVGFLTEDNARLTKQIDEKNESLKQLEQSVKKYNEEVKDLSSKLKKIDDNLSTRYYKLFKYVLFDYKNTTFFKCTSWDGQLSNLNAIPEIKACMASVLKELKEIELLESSDQKNIRSFFDHVSWSRYQADLTESEKNINDRIKQMDSDKKELESGYKADSSSPIYNMDEDIQRKIDLAYNQRKINFKYDRLKLNLELQESNAKIIQSIINDLMKLEPSRADN